ncbi:VOC family protein [Ochrobactrum haematophilum]|uniref:VOC family protein n=1 Tax=Brucella haematophila TaxID=419474 RepID=A0ABX1DPE3_9HYPH|nr:VOC family protein [Brucella haematophila]
MNSDLARNARSVDHLVLPVEQLDEARARLSLLGFTVAPNAQHPFGTANVCSFLLTTPIWKCWQSTASRFMWLPPVARTVSFSAIRPTASAADRTAFPE